MLEERRPSSHDFFRSVAPLPSATAMDRLLASPASVPSHHLLSPRPSPILHAVDRGAVQAPAQWSCGVGAARRCGFASDHGVAPRSVQDCVGGPKIPSAGCLVDLYADSPMSSLGPTADDLLCRGQVLPRSLSADLRHASFALPVRYDRLANSASSLVADSHAFVSEPASLEASWNGARVERSFLRPPLPPNIQDFNARLEALEVTDLHFLEEKEIAMAAKQHEKLLESRLHALQCSYDVQRVAAEQAAGIAQQSAWNREELLQLYTNKRLLCESLKEQVDALHAKLAQTVEAYSEELRDAVREAKAARTEAHAAERKAEFDAQRSHSELEVNVEKLRADLQYALAVQDKERRLFDESKFINADTDASLRRLHVEINEFQKQVQVHDRERQLLEASRQSLLETQESFSRVKEELIESQLLRKADEERHQRLVGNWDRERQTHGHVRDEHQCAQELFLQSRQAHASAEHSISRLHSELHEHKQMRKVADSELQRLQSDRSEFVKLLDEERGACCIARRGHEEERARYDAVKRNSDAMSGELRRTHGLALESVEANLSKVQLELDSERKAREILEQQHCELGAERRLHENSALKQKALADLRLSVVESLKVDSAKLFSDLEAERKSRREEERQREELGSQRDLLELQASSVKALRAGSEELKGQVSSLTAECDRLKADVDKERRLRQNVELKHEAACKENKCLFDQLQDVEASLAQLQRAFDAEQGRRLTLEQRFRSIDPHELTQLRASVGELEANIVELSSSRDGLLERHRVRDELELQRINRGVFELHGDSLLSLFRRSKRREVLRAGYLAWRFRVRVSASSARSSSRLTVLNWALRTLEQALLLTIVADSWRRIAAVQVTEKRYLEELASRGARAVCMSGIAENTMIARDEVALLARAFSHWHRHVSSDAFMMRFSDRGIMVADKVADMAHIRLSLRLLRVVFSSWCWIITLQLQFAEECISTRKHRLEVEQLRAERDELRRRCAHSSANFSLLQAELSTLQNSIRPHNPADRTTCERQLDEQDYHDRNKQGSWDKESLLCRGGATIACIGELGKSADSTCALVRVALDDNSPSSDRELVCHFTFFSPDKGLRSPGLDCCSDGQSP